MRSVGALHNRTHGRSGTRVHRIWKGINTRCLNQNHHSYQEYGARGVRLCAGWRAFEAFLADMGEPPTEEHSIDRRDNNGHYSCGKCEECIANGWPPNCRWATGSEQTRHTRRSHMITVGNETLPLAAWAERRGVKYTLIRDRLRIGWPPELAVNSPTGARLSRLTRV